MIKDLVIARSTIINTHAARVWDILTQPLKEKNYMFDCDICCDYKQGSTITWKGTHQNKTINWKGEIIEYVPGRIFQYSVFDPLTGADDNAENYMHVRYEIKPLKGKTELLTSISNLGGDPTRAEHVANDWDLYVLPRIKELSEESVLVSHEPI